MAALGLADYRRLDRTNSGVRSIGSGFLDDDVAGKCVG